MEKVQLRPRLSYSIAEVCKMTGISRSWMYKQWATGRGPRRLKAGTRTLIEATALEAWLRSLREPK